LNKPIEYLCVIAMLAALYSSAQNVPEEGFSIDVLSSRPEMISGGSALIQIDVPQEISLGVPIIKLNDQDITAAFHPDSSAHRVIGLVPGLRNGDNILEVFHGPKNKALQIVLNNHPISGPIFSGTQEQPFICQTQDFILPNGTSLGAPLDAKCSAHTVITYVYKSTASPGANDGTSATTAIKPLPTSTALPADVAWTTTSTGAKVPYVVRVETGTINRSIYQFAVLNDPTTDSEPGPLSRPVAWNGRLIYSFGGGCPGGWYKQGTTIGFRGQPNNRFSLINDDIVGKGYAEASATLNVFGNNCNSVIAAETMMMVKEQFIKTYGKPLFTIGRGGSGGAEQVIPIADSYPGLLDGIIPSLTFTDVLENAQLALDSQLLYHYFMTSGKNLSIKQKLAILGEGRIKDFASDVRRINPSSLCPAELPKSQIYDPATNRSGVRCDIYDHTVDVLGRQPGTGYAWRPLDNMGVQYGLAALNAGDITAAQFLELNEEVGGYDDSANFVSARNRADSSVLRVAYQKNLVVNGGMGLGRLPIIDLRFYRDLLPEGDVHQKFHSFSLRERLRKANGSFGNDVLLVGGTSETGSDPFHLEEYAIAKMDEWLSNLERDNTKEYTLDQIERSKPADLEDSCYTETGDRIIEPQTPTGGKCNSLYPTFESPRMVAGGPSSHDVLKCQLKPIDFSDYKVSFSDADKARLTKTFPTGVCDWSKPGVEQQTPIGTWLSY
jgi:hypothetical protein